MAGAGAGVREPGAVPFGAPTWPGRVADNVGSPVCRSPGQAWTLQKIFDRELSRKPVLLVCVGSDLAMPGGSRIRLWQRSVLEVKRHVRISAHEHRADGEVLVYDGVGATSGGEEIGRASCRERV